MVKGSTRISFITLHTYLFTFQKLDSFGLRPQNDVTFYLSILVGQVCPTDITDITCA